MNNRINILHERCLRIIYNDKTSSFANLLAKNGSTTIHTRNLRVLATEMFRVLKNMLTELMQELFCVRLTHYNLGNLHHFAIPSINSVYHGSESMSNLGPRICNFVSDGPKELRISRLRKFLPN